MKILGKKVFGGIDYEYEDVYKHFLTFLAHKNIFDTHKSEIGKPPMGQSIDPRNFHGIKINDYMVAYVYVNEYKDTFKVYTTYNHRADYSTCPQYYRAINLVIDYVLPDELEDLNNMFAATYKQIEEFIPKFEKEINDLVKSEKVNKCVYENKTKRTSLLKILDSEAQLEIFRLTDDGRFLSDEAHDAFIF